MERVRLNDDEVPRKQVSRRREFVYVPRPPRRQMDRLTLMHGLIEEIKFGNHSISKLYALLLARALIEIEPKVAAEFETGDEGKCEWKE